MVDDDVEASFERPKQIKITWCALIFFIGEKIHTRANCAHLNYHYSPMNIIRLKKII